MEAFQVKIDRVQAMGLMMHSGCLSLQDAIWSFPAWKEAKASAETPRAATASTIFLRFFMIYIPLSLRTQSVYSGKIQEKIREFPEIFLGVYPNAHLTMLRDTPESTSAIFWLTLFNSAPRVKHDVDRSLHPRQAKTFAFFCCPERSVA